MAINLPLPIEDRRMDPPQGVVGDSWNWYGVEAAAAKKSLVIHHSASPTNQDGAIIAGHHVKSNGWGGVGYHFVIRHDEYPGGVNRASGAGIEYVGDLSSWRAHVANDNPGRVGICLVGDFTKHKPGKRQLELTRWLIDFLMAPNNILPSINYFSQVVAHGQIAGQATACPGHGMPWFGDWFNYLKGGAFPHHFYVAPAPQPAPTPPPTPVPEPSPQPPVETVDNRPGWEKTWVPVENAQKMVVAVPSTDVFDFPANKVVKTLPGGELLADIGGTFAVEGRAYVRTKWSVEKGKWNGILLSELKEYVEQPPTPPQPPVNPDAPVDAIQPPVPAPEPTQELEDGEPEPQQPPQSQVMSQTPNKADRDGDGKVSLTEAILALLEAILGVLLSPLRLASMFKKKEK